MRERVPADHEVGDFAAVAQVLFDHAVEILRRETPVPGAFGVDDGCRAELADAQAANLGAVDAARLARTVELRGRLLQLTPGLFALLGSAAIRSDAEEDVPFVVADSAFFLRPPNPMG